MNTIIQKLFGAIITVVLLLMGLVFFASLLVVACLLLSLWLGRAVWARVTGQSVMPWTFQINPRAQWNRFYRPPGAGRPAPPQNDDVIDVVPREIKPPPPTPPQR